ncbi:MAG: site-2 protease family protein [Treponema sp.]|jgi:Zn-dependent protease|nr:site-2 protease family protein [Treponema sp.]
MDWLSKLYSIPGILLGLTVHECCHALCAWKLGDSTAKDRGRITLNPLKHIDIIGFIFIIFAGFGWAKPVQFNPEYLRHPRRDKALIAAAGPFSNLILGIVLILVLKGLFFLRFGIGNNAAEALIIGIYYAAVINFGLFVFNLIPIPPLDGSHIVFSGLNLSPETEYRIMRIGGPLLFLILIIQSRTDVTIIPIGKIVGAIVELLL